MPTDRELLLQFIQAIKEWSDNNLPIEHRVQLLQILNAMLSDMKDNSELDEIALGDELLMKWLGKSKGEA